MKKIKQIKKNIKKIIKIIRYSLFFNLKFKRNILVSFFLFFFIIFYFCSFNFIAKHDNYYVFLFNLFEEETIDLLVKDNTILFININDILFFSKGYVLPLFFKLYKFYLWNQVEILFILPFFSFLFIQFFFKNFETKKIKKIALFFSWIIFVHAINVSFNLLSANKIYIFSEQPVTNFKYLNYYYKLFNGVDYVVVLFDTSLAFIIIVSFITFCCVLISWTRESYHYKLLVSIFFLLQFFSFQFFSVYNLFFLYLYFEATIIPILILIGVWGSRFRKNIAFYYIYFITGFGSILMLIGILIIYNKVGTINTLEIVNLILNEKIDIFYRHLIWILLTSCFIIKLPGFLFYNWLLEAHVEAPVEGSVILSGYILKYAVWGLIGHVFLIFPFVSDFYTPYLITIASCSIIYSTLAAIRAHDFKKCVAYTSISHMSLAFLGLVSHSSLGFEGCLVLSFSHSFTSPGLFILAGLLYEKYGLRDIRYLAHNTLFLFSIYFFLLSLSNIGFPGTMNFFGEILIFCSLGGLGSMTAYISIIISIFFGAIFGIWIVTRINFTFTINKQFSDISFKEHSIFIFLCSIIILFGIYSLPLTYFLSDISSFYLVLRNNFLF